MDAEDKKTFNIDKNKLIIIFAIIILIVIVLLLLPSKESKKETIVSNQTTGEKLKVVGDNPYYLIKGNKFEDPGYEAYDANGNNISYKIVKSGAVNEKEPGNYYLIYRLGDIEIKRLVIVYNFEAILVEDFEEYTNEPYNLMVLIKGNNYDKTLLPNGETTKDRAIEYEIDKNGTYEFIAYDTHKNQIKIEKVVTNFDKEGPTGTCENKLDVGKTYVTVNASDDHSGVASYGYSNGKDYSTTKESKYTFNGLYKDVTVTLIDGLGNINKITCTSSGEGANPQIKPPANATIRRSADSDTLKVSIVEKSGYYLTYVWVLDPYNQINKGTSDWGKNTMKPLEILKREGLTNKIAVGVNGSGFYSKGAWDPNCSAACQKVYDKTTEGGLAINNGVVKKNYYQDSYADKSRNDEIYAISKEGYLDVFLKINDYSESGRQELFNNIIGKGYRNTWVFRPVLMMNGKKVSESLWTSFIKTKNKRTAMCQIDRNNFILFTTAGGNHDGNDLVSIFSSLNCQTAINLDGGGSVALIFKPKNGSVETIHGGGRPVVDTLYFTEK